MDLLVVPGSVFDEVGNRIGQGIGFFDRLLSQIRGRIPIVALAFEVQIVSDVPVSKKDVPVDLIVTEKRVIRCSKG